MTTPIKIAIGLGTIGAVGGASYAGVHYLSPNLEISKLIDEEYKHILLDTTEGKDTNHWETNWVKYKANKGNVFNLAGWKDDDTALNLTDALKKKCSELKTSYVYGSDDDLYKNVTIYCSRWVSIEDEASKDKLTVKNTKGAVDATWTQMVSVGEKDKWAKDFENLGIKHVPKGGAATILTAEEVQKGCAEAVKKHKGQADYKTAYESYKKVCANKSQG